MPLTAPTLTISDNGDGTGGVATITGSEAGSTNTLYRSPYGGIYGNLAWVNTANRSGDGTINVSPGTGQYFWYVDTTDNTGSHLASNLAFQALTDQTQSVHYRCLQAYQTRIQGLSLAGLPASQILIKWLPRVWPGVDNQALPAVYIVPLGKEGQPGELTGKDDIAYPVVVAIVDKLNQDYQSQLARYTLWRQRIFRAFRHQRLAGVPEILTTTVEPDYVLSPDWFAKNLWYSALLFKPTSRELRG